MVLHIMESERPGQRRGVPILAPVMERLKQLSRYSDAEIMAAVVSAFFTAAITSERGADAAGRCPRRASRSPTGSDGNQVPARQRRDRRPAPARSSSRSTRPPQRRLRAVRDRGLPQIGAGLGMPLRAAGDAVHRELLGVAAARSSRPGSASRSAGAHGDARFCQPIYEQWLEEAVARGYIRRPGFFADPLVRAAWCGAEWHGPTQGQLDPTKEVEAAEKRVAGGFSTRTRETAELTGGNWERNHRVASARSASAARGVADQPVDVDRDDPPADARTPPPTQEEAA
jgi:capsid protein